MCFCKSFWKASVALLTTSALILIAGITSAQTFFDNDDFIDPDSRGFDNVVGRVDGEGSSYLASVEISCADAFNDLTIGCEARHPDTVKLSKYRGQVDQGKAGNDAIAFIVATKIGDSKPLPVPIDAELVCERVQMKGLSNIKTNRMEVMCNLRKCAIPAGVTVDEFKSALECLDNELIVGKKVTNLRLNKKDQIIGRIRSEGKPD